jgi:methionine synthase I (cobalamin-dependent)
VSSSENKTEQWHQLKKQLKKHTCARWSNGNHVATLQFLKRISWRTFQRLSAFLKREQRFIVLTQPQAIKAVHAAYFAGADIVETNTFQALSAWPIIISKTSFELNYESAKLPVK